VHAWADYISTDFGIQNLPLKHGQAHTDTFQWMLYIHWQLISCHGRLCSERHMSMNERTNERTHARTHAHTHTHTRYQKGKTNLDFIEARDSEWQWHQLSHTQDCTSLQTDNHASTPPLSFLQAGCPSCHPTNSVKALKAKGTWAWYYAKILSMLPL